LSWRSSQSFEDSLRLPPVLTVTCSRPVVSFAILVIRFRHSYHIAAGSVFECQNQMETRIVYTNPSGQTLFGLNHRGEMWLILSY
jgi:hypothetical protein